MILQKLKSLTSIAKANRRLNHPKGCLCRTFYFKLDCFVVKKGEASIDTRSHLELKNSALVLHCWQMFVSG
jgi:hypothetical protein